MEQLPDVVIVLLLIGVDVDTTTELRRDILHSISLLCRRLPAEPGDDIVCFIRGSDVHATRLRLLGDLFGAKGVGPHDALLAYRPGTVAVIFHERQS
jgi:hypothetical protein